MPNILTDSLIHTAIYVQHCYTHTMRTETSTHTEACIHAFPPNTHTHTTHTETHCLSVSQCMSCLRTSFFQPLISVPLSPLEMRDRYGLYSHGLSHWASVTLPGSSFAHVAKPSLFPVVPDLGALLCLRCLFAVSSVPVCSVFGACLQCLWG